MIHQMQIEIAYVIIWGLSSGFTTVKANAVANLLTTKNSRTNAIGTIIGSSCNFFVEGIKIKIDKVICVKENLAWEAITSVEFVYVMLQSSLIIRGIWHRDALYMMIALPSIKRWQRRNMELILLLCRIQMHEKYTTSKFFCQKNCRFHRKTH